MLQRKNVRVATISPSRIRRRGIRSGSRTVRTADHPGSQSRQLGRSLHASVNAYNATIGTVEHRVMVTARRFRDLKVTEAELAPMGGVDQLPRGLSAPELIDAEQQESIIGVSKSPTHSVTVSSPNSGDKLSALSSEEPLNRPVHRRTSHSGRSGPTK